MTVKQRPPRITRSRQPAFEQAAALARLDRAEMVAAEALRPEGHQRGVGRSGHRILVNAVVGDENPAGDAVLVARRGDDRQ